MQDCLIQSIDSNERNIDCISGVFSVKRHSQLAVGCTVNEDPPFQDIVLSATFYLTILNNRTAFTKRREITMVLVPQIFHSWLRAQIVSTIVVVVVVVLLLLLLLLLQV